MKLDGQEESENVEDRRSGPPISATLGGGGVLLVLLLALVFKVSPDRIKQLLNSGPASGQIGQTSGSTTAPADPEEEKLAHFTKVIFGDTEKVWGDVFTQMGREYPRPILVLYSGQTQTACGLGEAAAGPFYCPGDQRVYIDLSFYREMQRVLNAPGEFARAYVVAHEVGHHVQGLLGYSKKVDEARQAGDKVEANHMSVRLELQADYFAGVWANKAQQKFNFLDPGDIETALNAANQIGDDTLQKHARGTVVPDTFTHGTSAQRVKWFKAGFNTGDVNGASALFDLPYESL